VKECAISFQGIPDYELKVPAPVDLQTIEARLKNGEYAALDRLPGAIFHKTPSGGGAAAFARDLRRIAANALRYNHDPREPTIRKVGRRDDVSQQGCLPSQLKRKL
jgi:hypothetical protein